MNYRPDLINLILSYATKPEVLDYFAETQGIDRDAGRRLLVTHRIYFPKYLATDLDRSESVIQFRQ